jgi:hypothetical protein
MGITAIALAPQMYEVVTPAKAGVQEASPHQHWIPAFAGMTAVSDIIGLQQ